MTRAPRTDTTMRIQVRGRVTRRLHIGELVTARSHTQAGSDTEKTPKKYLVLLWYFEALQNGETTEKPQILSPG